MSKLTDKARAISFDDIDGEGSPMVPSPVPEARPAAPPADRPRTGVGAFSASLAMGKRIEEENFQLKRQLQQFEDVVVVEFLDPKLIRSSRFANRHALSFSGADFDRLRDEIASAGRNIQAIKVRRAGEPVDGAQGFEIVYGHRRHRACLDLGLPVAAVVEDLTDVEMFTQMDRENRARADLTPWEQGLMYKRALDERLFSSQRQLAKSIGASQAAVNQALMLASLPADIVGVFPNPLALQLKWGRLIQDRLNKHPDAVHAIAGELAALEPKLTAKEILARLLEVASTALPAPQQLMSKGRAVGTIGTSRSGDLEIRINRGALTAAAQNKLSDYLAKLLA